MRKTCGSDNHVKNTGGWLLKPFFVFASAFSLSSSNTVAFIHTIIPHHDSVSHHSLASIHLHPFTCIHSLASIHLHPFTCIHSLASIHLHPSICLCVLPPLFLSEPFHAKRLIMTLSHSLKQACACSESLPRFLPTFLPW